MPHYEVTLLRHVPELQTVRIEADDPEDAARIASDQCDPADWESAKSKGEPEAVEIYRTTPEGDRLARESRPDGKAGGQAD